VQQPFADVLGRRDDAVSQPFLGDGHVPERQLRQHTVCEVDHLGAEIADVTGLRPLGDMHDDV